MAKKGNGEGSIYEHKRNRTKVGYRGAYTVHTASGPKRRYVTGKTREQVRQKLTRVIADRDGGLVFDAGSLTVGKYLKQWMETSVRGTVRTSTFEVHRHMIQPHIVPDLGRLKLKDLNPVHVRTFYREKLNSGLSAATVRKIEKIASREGISKHCLSARAPRYNRAELDAWLMGRRGAYHLGRSSPSTRPPPPWNSRWRP